jgi:ATP-dependent Clp protease ATP-binding subunit ClpA
MCSRLGADFRLTKAIEEIAYSAIYCYGKIRINLTVDEETIEMLIRKGITKALGARPMKQTVQKYLGDRVMRRVKRYWV